MALIKYPLENADSFITVAEADTMITNNVINSAPWLALANSVKEIYLRIAYKLIVDNSDEIVELPVCILYAQAVIANHDLTFGISTNVTTTKTGNVKTEKAGPFTTEYFDTKSKFDVNTPLVPDRVLSCLATIGYVSPTRTQGVTQTTLGRS